MTTIRDVVELVRLPAAISVPGDALAGAAAAGWPLGRRTVFAPAASVCFYLAGMALNDYADEDLDRAERPERPLPSGRISPRGALAVAAGLTGAGLALSAAAGRRPLLLGAAVAGAAWSYDLLAKPTAAGPAVMGAARGLDVLLGAGGAPAARPAALALAAHTTAVTALGRGEVHGSSAGTARAALAVTGITATTVAARGLRHPSGAGAGSALLAACYAGVYAASVGRAQLAAVTSPDPATVRRATGTGIRGMLPLQAALTAAAGAPLAGGALLALAPLLRRLATKVATT